MACSRRVPVTVLMFNPYFQLQLTPSQLFYLYYLSCLPVPYLLVYYLR